MTYLGLTLDKHLSWNAHVTTLCNKISATSGVLNKLKKILPRKTLKHVYFALVHSKLSYLAGLWGSAAKYVIKPLQILQKRCLKHVFKLPQRHPTSDLFSNYAVNVLNVQSLYKLSVCKFVHDCKNDTAYHTINFHKHRFETRSDEAFTIPYARTKIGSNAISRSGPTLYNKLPREIMNIMNIRKFNAALKKFLLQVQYPP